MSDTDQAPEAEKTLAEALLAAQAELPAVEPDQTNPHFKSKFVSLGNLLAKTKPVLNRHGLVLIQAPTLDEEGRFVLRTKIMHSSGEALVFDSPLMPPKEDPQGQGSAITYMRRYALASSLAIADQEDDDGAGAAERQAQRAPATDAESLALVAQTRKLRDEIRAIDDWALPAQSFDAAMGQREHSHERLEDFVGNLTELLADVRRFDELQTELAGVLEDEADWKKIIDRAQRRASRRERVEVLEKALAETKAKKESDSAEASKIRDEIREGDDEKGEHDADN